MHDYHEIQAGYDPRQVWYDGCKECERRAASLPDSIGSLDSYDHSRAIIRAKAWRKEEDIGPVAEVEIPLSWL